MIIEINEKYSVIKPTENSQFQDFYTTFIKKQSDYKKDHLILDLSDFKITMNELIQFKKIAEEKLASGTSFVLITKTVSYDEVPDEIIVVPTFQEAIDMIEMDEMTRSLDF